MSKYENSTAYAARLGVTPNEFPEFFDRDWDEDRQRWLDWRCTLPPPYSDDPRACLWEPFLMRALGWPVILYWTDGFNVKKRGLDESIVYPTPTAALAAAYDAKEAT